MGGRLLPILIELYQWLHTFLAHLVTRERAYKLTIWQVIQLANKVKPSLIELYQNVKGLELPVHELNYAHLLFCNRTV